MFGENEGIQRPEALLVPLFTEKDMREVCFSLQRLIFGATRLPANKVLLIAYLWLTKSLSSAMMVQAGVNLNTITNWSNHLRDSVTWDVENLDVAQAPIGGEGIIVEIDE